jgi:hypothetical protein
MAAFGLMAKINLLQKDESKSEWVLCKKRDGLKKKDRKRPLNRKEH